MDSMPMTTRNRIDNAAWLLLLLTLACGCTAQRDRLRDARETFYGGDPATAAQQLQELAADDNQYRVTSTLDAAIAHLAAGDLNTAEQLLRQQRDAVDHANAATVAGEHLANARSILTDDRTRAYQPAGYEQVMMRALLAMCSLAGDGVDAESYALQCQTHQQALIAANSRDQEDSGLLDAFMSLGQTPPEMRHNAIAPYLRGMLREGNRQNDDDAVSAYQQVALLQPSFTPATTDLQRVQSGHHVSPGHGVLYVFALVGRGPQRQAIDARGLSSLMNVTSVLVSATEDRTTIPLNAPIRVPDVVLPPQRIGALRVGVVAPTGQSIPLGIAQPITNVIDLAMQQQAVDRPRIIARAVQRRIAKEATVRTLLKSKKSDQGPDLLQSLAMGGWTALEQPDLRCWSLLPREIAVMRLELPAGDHTITLEPVDSAAAPIGAAATQRVRIDAGYHSYLIAFAPDASVMIAASKESQAATQRPQIADATGNTGPR
ncbi:MAG: hypothetical protein AAFP90_09200 [Planctomycetota bacterium]